MVITVDHSGSFACSSCGIDVRGKDWASLLSRDLWVVFGFFSNFLECLTNQKRNESLLLIGQRTGSARC